MQLEKCREMIDVIDTEILILLNRRATVSRKIGAIKMAAGLPIVDEHRESSVIGRIVRDNPGDMSDDSVVRVYQEILAESREIQMAAIAESTEAAERTV